MSQSISPSFDQPGIATVVDALDEAGLDALGFGVIGFDREGRVRRYNACESQAAGIGVKRVIGQDLFMVVAPCMNNFMVAQRFHDAHEQGQPLDVALDYVLTFRMRPTKVRLRLLSEPDASLSYILVQRS
jgi:photoactive yellow protein